MACMGTMKITFIPGGMAYYKCFVSGGSSLLFSQ